jgi:Ca2+/Na+ antiporter
MVMVSRRRGPGRFLDWKLRLFMIAGVLLLVGMTRQVDLLVGIAIALLVVAFVLRFFEGEKAEETPADDEEFDEDEELAAELPASPDPRNPGQAAERMGEEPRRTMD